MAKRITVFGAGPEDLAWIATAIGVAQNERTESNLVGVMNKTLGNKASVRFTRAGIVVHFEKMGPANG